MKISFSYFIYGLLILITIVGGFIYLSTSNRDKTNKIISTEAYNYDELADKILSTHDTFYLKYNQKVRGTFDSDGSTSIYKKGDNILIHTVGMINTKHSEVKVYSISSESKTCSKFGVDGLWSCQNSEKYNDAKSFLRNITAYQVELDRIKNDENDAKNIVGKETVCGFITNDNDKKIIGGTTFSCITDDLFVLYQETKISINGTTSSSILEVMEFKDEVDDSVFKLPII